MKCRCALRRSRAGLHRRQRDAERRQRPKILAAALCAEVAQRFFIAGKMPSDGNGKRYWPPRPAQKSCGDFLVADYEPSNSGLQKRFATAPRLMLCEELLLPAMLLSDSGQQDEVPPRPAQKSRGDFLVAGEKPSDGDG